MIRAIAIDDEPLSLEVIAQYCSNVNFITLDGRFTKTIEALAHLKQHRVDLLFLDIQMPSISGINFYKALDQDIMVIFTTAFSEYAVEGFNLNAIDYLLKPFSQQRFLTAVNKANEYYQFLQGKQIQIPTHIFLRSEYSLVKIAEDEIRYIEGLADYLRVFLENGKPVITRLTMKKMMERLSASFIRVHRSYIVPIHRIDSVRNRMITVGSKEIPIGKTYFPAFNDVFNQRRDN